VARPPVDLGHGRTSGAARTPGQSATPARRGGPERLAHRPEGVRYRASTAAGPRFRRTLSRQAARLLPGSGSYCQRSVAYASSSCGPGAGQEGTTLAPDARDATAHLIRSHPAERQDLRHPPRHERCQGVARTPTPGQSRSRRSRKRPSRFLTGSLPRPRAPSLWSPRPARQTPGQSGAFGRRRLGRTGPGEGLGTDQPRSLVISRTSLTRIKGDL
jgi:hypothetical protein